MTETSLLAAFVLGLMGAGHCIGMCGGIISALSISTDDKSQKWINISAYQLGRISSYVIFGLIAGLLGSQVERFTAFPILKILSGMLLIFMGLYISRLWMALSYLEKLGKLIWNHLSPLSKKLLPVKTVKHALLLGFLWGWLPCGLVYTSLGYALTKASPIESALFMLAFGLGTLPATLLAGATSMTLKRWLNLKIIRFTTALLFVAFGCLMLYSLQDGANMPHQHH